VIISRAPYRVTFAGGGNDRPEFYKKHGGFFISMAINSYLYISLKTDSLEGKVKLKYSKSEEVENIEDLQHDRAREALKLYGLKDSIEISSSGDIPANTGMGSSGSYLVALLKAIQKFKRKSCSVYDLAEDACRIEIETLKLPVGKQDQFISAYGGFNSFFIDKNGKVTVDPVNITSEKMRELKRKIHLYYLGSNFCRPRSASHALKKQNCQKNEEILLRMKELGYQTLDILENGDLSEYGNVLNEYWNIKKQLSEEVSNSSIDDLYDTVKKKFGVVGGKLIGAGGGGFLMTYSEDRHNELQRYMEKAKCKKLNFSPDYEGAKILGDFR